MNSVNTEAHAEAGIQRETHYYQNINTENPFTLLFVLSTLCVHLNLTLGFYLNSKPPCKDSNTLLTEPTGVIKVLLKILPKTF